MGIILDMVVNDKGSKTVKSFTDTTKRSITDLSKTSTTASAAMAAGNQKHAMSINTMRLKYLAYAAVIGTVIYTTKKMISQTVEHRDSIMKLSRATGFSTDALVGFRHAAEIGGSSAAKMTVAIRGLYRNMQGVKDGLTESKRAFDQLGVTVLDSNGNMRKGEEVLFDVADAMSGMQNSAEKAAIAQELFGRSGLELVPMLAQGRAGLEQMIDRAKELGLTFSETAGKQAEEYKDAMLELKRAWQGLSQAIVTDSIPSLTAVARSLTDGFIQARMFKDVLITELWYGFQKAQLAAVQFAETIEDVMNPKEWSKNNISALDQLRKQLETNMIGVEAARKQSLDEVSKSLNLYYANQMKVNRSLAEMSEIEPAEFAPAGTAAAGGEKPTTGKVSDQIKEYQEVYEEQKNAEQDFVEFSKAKKIELSDFNRDMYENQLEIDKAMFEERTAMAAEYYNENLTLQQNVAAIEKRINEEKLAIYQSVLGSIGQLFYSLSDQMGGALEAYKFFAITETGISTIKSAQKAYEAVISNVWLGPAAIPAAIAAAAAATIQGMARVNEIRKMATGGEFITQGPQMIMVGDNPSGREHVSVTPLDAGPKYQMGQRNVTFNVIISEKVDKQSLRNELLPMMQQIAEYG